MSHHACGKKGQPHPPHRFRRFLWGMGAVYQTWCDGEVCPHQYEGPLMFGEMVCIHCGHWYIDPNWETEHMSENQNFRGTTATTEGPQGAEGADMTEEKCWRHDYDHREYVCRCDPPVEGDTGSEGGAS